MSSTYTLSKELVEILRNFADINPQVIFKAGQAQRVCGTARNFIADVEFKDALPREFALYELNKLTGLIDSMTVDAAGKSPVYPVITLGETSLSLTQGAMKSTIPYSHTEAIQPPPAQTFTLTETFATFTITEADWAKLRKIASILQHDMLHMQITDDKKVILRTLGDAGKTTDNNDFTVPGAQVFSEDAATWAIKLDALKLLPGNYTVEIGNVVSSTSGEPAAGTKGLFGTYFTLNDPNRKVTYLTGGHVAKTRNV